MTRTRNSIRWAVALLASVVAFGCGGGGELSDEDIAGYWAGDWGQMVLQSRGDLVYGTYSHDNGTLVGSFDGEVFVGWWCETPSREASSDAGDAEFDFFVDEAGVLQLDGRWRYGTEGDMRENWDLSKQDSDPPAALLERFDDPSAFCSGP